jgi:hypothetical protein
VGQKQNENPMMTRTANMLTPLPSAGWSVYGAIAVWLAAVAVAYWSIEHYEFATTDSSAAEFADHWPNDSKLPRQANHSTLVLFLHPKCPCSRASLSEIERLFTSIDGPAKTRPDFVVNVTVPQTASEDWLQTATLERVKAIADARIYVDWGGVEAAKFGATTSGFVMLFGENGSRQYAGGVTESRGHEGDNAGRNSLARILCHEIEMVEGIPAFGCRLCLPENERPTATTEIRAS